MNTYRFTMSNGMIVYLSDCPEEEVVAHMEADSLAEQLGLTVEEEIEVDKIDWFAEYGID